MGYGDRYPTSPAGRLIGVAMIVVGVSLFSVLASFIATGFVVRRRSVEQKSETNALRDELVDLLTQQRRSAEIEAAALRADLAQLRQLLEAKATRFLVIIPIIGLTLAASVLSTSVTTLTLWWFIRQVCDTVPPPPGVRSRSAVRSLLANAFSSPGGT